MPEKRVTISFDLRTETDGGLEEMAVWEIPGLIGDMYPENVIAGTFVTEIKDELFVETS